MKVSSVDIMKATLEFQFLKNDSSKINDLVTSWETRKVSRATQ